MFYGFYHLSWTFSDVLSEVNFMICNRKIKQKIQLMHQDMKNDSKENCEIET